MTTAALFEPERSEGVQQALSLLSSTGSIEDLGAVFTKSAVVDGILDLCGYAPSKPLHQLRLLEPAFGRGDFLIPAIHRLLNAAIKHEVEVSEWHNVLRDAIFAVELHRETFELGATRARHLLLENGMSGEHADELLRQWLHQDDFLLIPISSTFDFTVGNPPYVRQERIPAPLLSEYKRRYDTLYDRADLYVLFYERSLRLLAPDGVLGFICANRWIKNKYGGPLRALIDGGYNVDMYVDLHGADAFHSQVDAYPAITVIRRSPSTETAVITSTSNLSRDLPKMFRTAMSHFKKSNPSVTVVRNVTNNSDPWLLDMPEILSIIRDLENRHPTLEESGAKVGIGVATGCDKVYIGEFESLPVEQSQKLKLVMSGDLKGTKIKWSGKGVVNPWGEDSSLINLTDFPDAAKYFALHSEALHKRHVAKKNPTAWYKTIDRIYSELTNTPKLLIPDIKGASTVVYDEGRFYPHHNLYHITSSTWDLRVLQALLRSSVALAFVAAYSVRMSGGFLRFQAQYLRRIRIPSQADISSETATRLVALSESTDICELDDVVCTAYGISTTSKAKLLAFAAGARVGKS